MLFCKKNTQHALYKIAACPIVLYPSYTALEDGCLPDEVETYHWAVKNIAKNVNELIGEKPVEQGNRGSCMLELLK